MKWKTRKHLQSIIFSLMDEVAVLHRLETHLKDLCKRGGGSYSSEIGGYILAMIDRFRKEQKESKND